MPTETGFFFATWYLLQIQSKRINRSTTPPPLPAATGMMTSAPLPPGGGEGGVPVIVSVGADWMDSTVMASELTDRNELAVAGVASWVVRRLSMVEVEADIVLA